MGCSWANKCYKANSTENQSDGILLKFCATNFYRMLFGRHEYISIVPYNDYNNDKKYRVISKGDCQSIILIVTR